MVDWEKTKTVLHAADSHHEMQTEPPLYIKQSRQQGTYAGKNVMTWICLLTFQIDAFRQRGIELKIKTVEGCILTASEQSGRYHGLKKALLHQM